ncbi:heme/hemin ABC transporter substrate-binding protein [Xanthocytophaga agilis]|uniref:ABC transporter substrate-binding protein n=1 Tax=Xanthocytophaga agilis TaxID=3048010 RepID=A0AAE3R4V7_9BACT|nr:ABC transporter substrate-binding protein [Xanthocytophaga agilis]MDJ1503706.1 ABC transporter substrate-binding protein [Xanthocytophaga agilis]
MKKIVQCLLVVTTLLMGSATWAQQKIVSLNGAVTEILCELGLQNQIVGTDITSNYPAEMQKKPKVGHNRTIGAEAVLALQPTLIVGIKDKDGKPIDIKPELVGQFQSAGIKTILFEYDYSIDGAKKLIQGVAEYFNQKQKAVALIKKIDEPLAKVKKPAKAPKVLFIYARGTGTMLVAGLRTAPKTMIELAGGQNATNDFENFKPLTAEALVAANPDAILLFDSGLESLGGIDGLLKVPGIAQTNAGKHKRIWQMDGQFLTGFSPRAGQAVLELNTKMTQITP